MKLIPRCLASALVSLAALHTAQALPLDTQREEPASEALFPTPPTHEGNSPLTAVLQPRIEAPALGETHLSPPAFVPPRDTPTGASLLMVSSGETPPARSPLTIPAPRGYYVPSPALEAVLPPPDMDLGYVALGTADEEKGLDSRRMGPGDLPMPITIPEPRSASLLAIGLAGLGLRACWGARQRAE
ncbi:MAG: hypothetical protein JNK74_07040 [Candidatus Hydrogenedentes bacterium]|nr:hypothetical protein [Candidatus Hydrogenedentota bacterium]